VGGKRREANGGVAGVVGEPEVKTAVPENMPGILKGSHDRVDSNSVKVAAAMDSGVAIGDGPREPHGAELTNGVNGTVPSQNGFYANGMAEDPATSPENVTSIIKAVSDPLPPEIVHITDGFFPLSRLMTRLAQDTYNGLEEIVNQLADMEPAQGNGIASNQPVDAGLLKKQKLFNWTQEQRQKYIKAMVISQWSKRAHEVSKVIDLHHYLARQRALYKEAVSWIGELKRQIGPMKLPGPDVKTALEVLSTGKAARISDVSTELQSLACC
jgi:mediator of RNA polymerase II transcription subunit 14